jgi:uncharacterized membrane protein YraQ (UPF0718 family)
MNVLSDLASKPAKRQQKLATSLAILGAAIIAFTFWTQQRYPSLIKKLHAGEHIEIKAPLGFDALLPVNSQMPPAERIVRTSVNWLWTNRFGMYFALPFGAAMMTLLESRLRARRFDSPGKNTLCGAVAGMPLGVCANCATPIGQGLLDAGASSQMTTAAMISSPSFNPVVLTMAFALFPQPLPWLRLLTPAILVGLIPWIIPENTPAIKALPLLEEKSPTTQQIVKFLKTFGNNLLRLFLLTLPWLVLAAVFGAAVVETIPQYGTRLPASIYCVAVIAIIGTLLPVPMAFDIALSYVLYRSGVPIPYVAALLCTLGPVSIYSLAALTSPLGRNPPLRLAIVTIALGCMAGWITMAR